MVAEIWRPVVGWESHYEVSSLGRVRRIVGGQGARAGHILKPLPFNFGYVGVRLHAVQRHPKTIRIHRLVALAFLPRDPLRPQVNHKNGITGDNRLENLEWCTDGENLTHSYKTLGRKASPIKGEGNFNARLTADKVRSIREAHKRGETFTEIARRFGITRGGVRKVCLRLSWNHIPEEVTQ